MGNLDEVEHTADAHGFIAPLKLEGLAELETQEHESLGRARYGLHSPAADVVGDGAVAAAVALRLNLGKQGGY